MEMVKKIRDAYNRQNFWKWDIEFDESENKNYGM